MMTFYSFSFLVFLSTFLSYAFCQESTNQTFLHPKIQFKEAMKNFRHIKYCEILSSRNQLGISHALSFTAYNTLLYGCPDDKWQEVKDGMVWGGAQHVRKLDGAWVVKLNGPRYWLFDTVSQGSTLVDPTVSLINTMPMIVVGIVEVGIVEVMTKLLFDTANLYTEREVRRETEYIFYANKPVYYLKSDTNKTYGMQSYTTQIYNVTQDNLNDLGSVLKLPPGWTYNVAIPTKNFHLKAINAIGVIVNDELLNVYSRFDFSVLEAAMGVDSCVSSN